MRKGRGVKSSPFLFGCIIICVACFSKATNRLGKVAIGKYVKKRSNIVY
jgi:hypothetical protein